MWNGAKAGKQILQTPVGKQERISAGKQHVPNSLIPTNILNTLVDLRARVMLFYVSDKILPEAIPAIGRTYIGHLEGDPVGIHMYHRIDRGVFLLEERVECAQVVREFLNGRYLLAS